MVSENKKSKNPICAVWWYDAAYSFDKDIPEIIPDPRLTVGFVVDANDDFLNIATDVGYDEDTGEIIPERGHLIPEKAIVNFEKIRDLHE